MIPYAMAVLLSILTFPKPYALIAIYTLAIADPLSAIIGIRFGKHRIVSHKSLEGSAAFFTATFFISFFILYSGETDFFWVTTGTSLVIALFSSIFEMLPVKLDDNLTIPLAVGFVAWISSAIFL
jgi:dolichol kinase